MATRAALAGGDGFWLRCSDLLVSGLGLTPMPLAELFPPPR